MVKGVVSDNLCVLVQLVSILKHVQLLSIIRHKKSMHAYNNRKQKLGIQEDEYIEIKKLKEVITKVKRNHKKRLVPNGDIEKKALASSTYSGWMLQKTHNKPRNT